MQKLNTTNSSKVVRISTNNYQRLVSQGAYGETFDSILSKVFVNNTREIESEKTNMTFSNFRTYQELKKI